MSNGAQPEASILMKKGGHSAMKAIMQARDQQARDVLALLKGVATDEGKLPLHEIHEKTLEAVAEHLLKTEIDLANLDPSLARAAEQVSDPDLRLDVLNLAGVLPFLEVETLEQKVGAFERLAEGFEFDKKYAKELHALAHKKAAHLELDSLRAARLELGASALKLGIKALAGFFHLDGNKEMLARYEGYEALAEDTFGHNLIRYYRDNDFPIPGTAGAPFSNTLQVHDMHHVLAGYPTTPVGEMCVLAFDGAMMQEDAGKLLIAAAAEWQIGFQISADPVWKNQFKPDIILRAYERGGEATTNYLVEGFDFHPYLEQKLADVRAEFGIASEGALIQSPKDLWCGDMGVVGSRESEDKVEEKRGFLNKYLMKVNTN